MNVSCYSLSRFLFLFFSYPGLLLFCFRTREKIGGLAAVAQVCVLFSESSFEQWLLSHAPGVLSAMGCHLWVVSLPFSFSISPLNAVQGGDSSFTSCSPSSSTQLPTFLFNFNFCLSPSIYSSLITFNFTT